MARALIQTEGWVLVGHETSIGRNPQAQARTITSAVKTTVMASSTPIALPGSSPPAPPSAVKKGGLWPHSTWT